MKLFAFIFLLSSITANAQFNVQEVVDPSDLEWGEGSILLNDGTELKGLIKYNDRAGILSFESGATSRSFTSRRVSGFEFYDEREKKQRIFYSIIYEDAETNAKSPLFFELIKDLKTFAVITKTDRVKIEAKSSGGGPSANGGYVGVSTTYSASQLQTIYFMDSQGNIVPYMKATKKKLDTNRPKPMYSKLEKYADDNKLDFDEKEDFFKILDYYETLINE